MLKRFKLEVSSFINLLNQWLRPVNEIPEPKSLRYVLGEEEIPEPKTIPEHESRTDEGDPSSERFE